MRSSRAISNMGFSARQPPGKPTGNPPIEASTAASKQNVRTRIWLLAFQALRRGGRLPQVRERRTHAWGNQAKAPYVAELRWRSQPATLKEPETLPFGKPKNGLSPNTQHSTHRWMYRGSGQTSRACSARANLLHFRYRKSRGPVTSIWLP
jgi:hypothetical protein